MFKYNFEAVKYNVSYHIYEPYDLGLSARDIKNLIYLTGIQFLEINLSFLEI